GGAPTGAVARLDGAAAPFEPHRRWEPAAARRTIAPRAGRARLARGADRAVAVRTGARPRGRRGVAADASDPRCPASAGDGGWRHPRPPVRTGALRGPRRRVAAHAREVSVGPALGSGPRVRAAAGGLPGPGHPPHRSSRTVTTFRAQRGGILHAGRPLERRRQRYRRPRRGAAGPRDLRLPRRRIGPAPLTWR